MNTLIQTALELGLISSVVALGLFLSYTMLDICDLSTEGCFTLGACTGAVIAIGGHPYTSLLGALVAGALCGFVFGLLQTYFGINSLLAGIVVNTALYSVNIAIMGNTSLLNMNKTETVFTNLKELLESTPLNNKHVLLFALFVIVVLVVLLNWFLKTRLGLAIRATGDNFKMVETSSINPKVITIITLSISGSISALAGCLLAQSQKSVNIDIGSGILTIALASLLIGRTLNRSRSLMISETFVVIGSIIFRTIYTIALRLNMPAYMLKFVSALIVTIAISFPYLKQQYSLIKRKRNIYAETE